MEERFARKVVTLSTIRPEGVLFEIDGQTYESVPPSWWGVPETFRSRRYIRKISEVESAVNPDNDTSDPTEEDIAEYEHSLREMAKIILPSCPEGTIHQLSTSELAVLVRSFLMAVRGSNNIPESRNSQNEQNGESSQDTSDGTSNEPILVAS